MKHVNTGGIGRFLMQSVLKKHLGVFYLGAVGATSRPFPLALQFFSSIITTVAVVAVARKSTAKKWNGVVAQLVERLVRNEKVAGSIPVGSTIQNLFCYKGFSQWYQA